MNISERLRERLRMLPDQPGVYMFRDRRGEVIYVGKARSLRNRVRQYFRAATLRRADPKLRSLVRSVEDLEIIPLRSEPEAAVVEGRLIKEFKPRYNVAFRDDKRFLLLRVDLREPWPRFTLHRIQRPDGAEWFGPYPSSVVARTALEFLDKHFGLRRCSPRVPGPEDHRHCLNDIVRYCSAPCIGRISPEEYKTRVDQACRFLRGEDRTVLALLQDAMRQAAQSLDFERAAALRDLGRALDRAIREHALARRTALQSARASEHALNDLAERLGLARPPAVIECYDVSNIGGTLAVGSMVVAVQGRPCRSRYRRFRIQTVTSSDDPRMMAEVLRRRAAHSGEPEWGRPDLIVLDGGITQLRAARAALDEVGWGEIPTVALAKRLEQVYGGPRGEEKVLDVPADAPALSVLKLLRDEAHRFALDYHRRLRSKRLAESVLDEIPGIGRAKKVALLRHFGSIARMKEASVEEIAKVPGVGAKLGLAVYTALHPE